MPVKVQNDIIMYQFLPWPGNDVQIFKPVANLEFSGHEINNNLLTGSLFDSLKQTQKNVLVKDVAESWDYVAWTVVRVWEISVDSGQSVRT